MRSGWWFPVRKGREFTDQDTELGLPVAIVNEWAARRWWPGRDPVGQTIRVDSVPGQGITVSVVGVVADNKAAQQNLLVRGALGASRGLRPGEVDESALGVGADELDADPIAHVHAVFPAHHHAFDISWADLTSHKSAP